MTITLHDPALELASFKRQLKTFLFARYQAQRTERIRDVMIMRYTNILFTYLLQCAISRPITRKLPKIYCGEKTGNSKMGLITYTLYISGSNNYFATAQLGTILL